jgi:hypothetical protein
MFKFKLYTALAMTKKFSHSQAQAIGSIAADWIGLEVQLLCLFFLLTDTIVAHRNLQIYK